MSLPILADLDRCEHGRHRADDCIGCGGQSSGNRYLATGDRIGTTYYGAPIIVPDQDRRYDAGSWVAR